MESKGETNFHHPICDVKFWADREPELEASRPSHCHGCGAAVGLPGALRIHGHGTRERLVLGPAAPDHPGELVCVVLQRFRCLACGCVMTIRPSFLARYFRYSVAAIGLALWLWATVRMTQSEVRAEVSPWPIRGPSDADRWRSLGRWTGRAAALFGLPDNLHESGARTLAARVAGLLVGRAPPELPERARAFAGAQLR